MGMVYRKTEELLINKDSTLAIESIKLEDPRKYFFAMGQFVKCKNTRCLYKVVNQRTHESGVTLFLGFWNFGEYGDTLEIEPLRYKADQA